MLVRALPHLADLDLVFQAFKLSLSLTQAKHACCGQVCGLLAVCHCRINPGRQAAEDLQTHKVYACMQLQDSSMHPCMQSLTSSLHACVGRLYARMGLLLKHTCSEREGLFTRVPVQMWPWLRCGQRGSSLCPCNSCVRWPEPHSSYHQSRCRPIMKPSQANAVTERAQTQHTTRNAA
jgi:hypothetical protein